MEGTDQMALAIKTDTDIQQDVLDELEWDPELRPNEIGVEVEDGVVTLTGTIDAYAKKLAAQHAAFRVQGVRAVANDLTYHTAMSKPNDTDIAGAAALALGTHAYGDLSDLEISVTNGKITLAGSVDWEFQRQAAERAVRYLRGVRDVINDITLLQPRVSADVVVGNIERALVRSAEVDANQIRVHIEHSHVRLTGTVGSWGERRAAEEATWRAHGVTDVTNELRVVLY